MGTSEREERFEDLYRRHQRSVLAYAFRRADRAEALDVAADTFLVAWRRIDEVPSGDEALLWLYGTARRVLSNHRRSLTRAASLREKLAGLRSESSPTPETVVVRRVEDEEMLLAVERLRPDDQEVLRLTVWEELPRDQVAAVLGTSQQAVRQRLYRITKQLARRLREEPNLRAGRTTPGIAGRREEA